MSQAVKKNILKNFALFGSVQVYTIFISIIKSKVIAVLLGVNGIGISGLYNSAIGLITSLTSFGLRYSAIKNISVAHANQDEQRISFVVSVFKKIIWITGLLGMSVTILLSPYLSKVTFGNYNYVLPIILISVTLLLGQINSGHQVILQGTKQFKHLAKASIIGSTLGVFTTLPIYYFMGIEGIVPAMIVGSVSALIISGYFARKTQVKTISVTNTEAVTESKEMLKTGFVITVNGLILALTSYILRVFIRTEGATHGIHDVGLYNVGFTIINTYVGMIFSAMLTDYFPRVATVVHDELETKKLINEQTELSLLVLTPLINFFLVFINLIIILLYSNRFTEINTMILWAMMGIFFKAGSWAIAGIFVPKGDNKLFFWNELVGNAYLLLLNILGYKFFGMTGLGVSFLVGYFLYFIQVYFIAQKKYKVNYTARVTKVFLLQMLFTTANFCNVLFISKPYCTLIGSVFLAISCYYSYQELSKETFGYNPIKKMIDKFKK